MKIINAIVIISIFGTLTSVSVIYFKKRKTITVVHEKNSPKEKKTLPIKNNQTVSNNNPNDDQKKEKTLIKSSSPLKDDQLKNNPPVKNDSPKKITKKKMPNDKEVDLKDEEVEVFSFEDKKREFQITLTTLFFVISAIACCCTLKREEKTKKLCCCWIHFLLPLLLNVFMETVINFFICFGCYFYDNIREKKKSILKRFFKGGFWGALKRFFKYRFSSLTAFLISLAIIALQMIFWSIFILVFCEIKTFKDFRDIKPPVVPPEVVDPKSDIDETT